MSCIKKASQPRSFCPKCHRFSVSGLTHPNCQRPYGLDGLICLWRYEGVIRQALLSLKYRFAWRIAEELSFYAAEELEKRKALFPKEACLMPVPLYWQRRNWRGFNQSEEMGRILAKALNWQFSTELLARKAWRVPQARLKGKWRSKNIRGVFVLNPNYQSLTINPQSLIIFDDVWTTGATIKEAAKVLKRGGFRKVFGLTIACSLGRRSS